MRYSKKLPKEVKDKLDAYIKRIEAIKWFNPSDNFNREAAEKQIAIVLKSFGVKALVEWWSLKTYFDWNNVRPVVQDEA